MLVKKLRISGDQVVKKNLRLGLEFFFVEIKSFEDLVVIGIIFV